MAGAGTSRHGPTNPTAHRTGSRCLTAAPHPPNSQTRRAHADTTFRQRLSPSVSSRFTPRHNKSPRHGSAKHGRPQPLRLGQRRAVRHPCRAQGQDERPGCAKTRAKESHYTTEEAREAALRRELESIKNVNKVIEGVVDSLQKAKDNMEVGMALSWNVPSLTMDRRFPRQSKMHRHSFRHGQGSCLRLSTTSV
jgi:hypothetical protein